MREFANPADIATLPERLVSTAPGSAPAPCSATGLQPARGQLAILLPQPEIPYAFTGEAGYMFPRADGILLGGTFELDQWEAIPEPERSPASSPRTSAVLAGFPLRRLNLSPTGSRIRSG